MEEGHYLTQIWTKNFLSGFIHNGQKKNRVTRRMIISKAKEIHQSHVAAGQYQKNVEFEASIGWLQKFMCRHNLSCRIATTVCQKPPEAYDKKIVLNFCLCLTTN